MHHLSDKLKPYHCLTNGDADRLAINKMKTVKIFLVMSLVVILNGCAVKRFESEIETSNFIVEETSKLGVYQALGQPHSVDTHKDSKLSVWYYFSGDVSLNPVTFVPYAGLLFGGVDVDFEITALRFSGERESLSNIGKFQVQRYVNQWARKEQIANSEEANKNVKAEVEKLGFNYDEELAKKVRFYHSLLPDHVPNFQSNSEKME